MLQIKVSGEKRLARQISALADGKKDQRRLMRDAGRMVMRETKARLRGQRSPDGTPWPKRKRANKRKRMMLRLGKSMTLRGLSEKGVTVTWKKGSVAMTAKRHHDGFTQKYGRRAKNERT